MRTIEVITPAAMPQQTRYPFLEAALKGLHIRGVNWRCWTIFVPVDTTGHPETVRHTRVYLVVSSDGSVRILGALGSADVFFANSGAEAVLERYRYCTREELSEAGYKQALLQYPQLGARVKA